MGKKRSRRSYSDEENKQSRLEKRLRRLERREKERNRERRRKRHERSSSDYLSSSEASSWSNSESRSRSRSISNERTQSRDKSPEKIGDAPVDANSALPPNVDNSQNQGNIVTVPTVVGETLKASESNTPKQVIDEKALEALGKHLTINKPPGPPICDELVSRWGEILAVGLPKDDRAALLLKYGTPSNCSGINAPKLNPEVKASLTEPVTSRDARLVTKQDKVTVCISALGAVLSKLLCGETVERLSLIEVLSDTEKLLVDLQREESMTRKALIVTNLNASVKDALNATSIDEWLFGKQLEESIKTAKTLERSSKQIKAVSKASTSYPAKNFKAPLQQRNYKQRGSSWGGQRKPYASKSASNHHKPDPKNERYSRKKRQ